jgi:flavin reductase (DIM6/NTAB) family NADH-FMN oxidoreductase RutF|nr:MULTISPECIES: flavin reductase family protein [unclassified Rhodococcus (in: high G+C Gram-positive bacteria)]
MDAGDYYKLLTTSVVPRPIAWVSTVSADGVPNLAPYSFFSVSSSAPAVVQFTSVGRKDSLRNIEETGEFVINLATESLFEQINQTSANYDASVSEYTAVDLESEPSETVRPPRVVASPLSIEATLHQVVEVGNSFVVMGAVTMITVRPEFLAEDGLPDFGALAPLSRLGRDEWGMPPAVRRIQRPDRP